MLIEGLYDILTTTTLSEENDSTVAVHLNKEHELFKGHFPENPVLPGVVMLQIIKELSEKQLQKKLFLKAASNVKFLAPVDPGVNSKLILKLHIQQDNGFIKVKNQTTFEDGTIVLKCNVTFVELNVIL